MAEPLTTEAVRDLFVLTATKIPVEERAKAFDAWLATDPRDNFHDFSRWMAAHDREVAAMAWDEGAQFDPDPASRKNPYRETT